MIFSWFTSLPSIQTDDSYDPNQKDHLQQLSTTTTPFTKEEDGWIQVITDATEKKEDNDQQVPNGNYIKVKDTDKKDVVHTTTTTTTTTAVVAAAAAATETTIEPKKMSRQQRRYQARLAQQQSLKKQKQMAGEEQLKTALKLGQQRKSKQKQWVDQWIPHSNSISPNTSCLPTRSTSLTTGLD